MSVTADMMAIVLLVFFALGVAIGVVIVIVLSLAGQTTRIAGTVGQNGRRRFWVLRR